MPISSFRLEDLNKLLQPDLSALPDRTLPEQTTSSNTARAGGVSLETGGRPQTTTSKQQPAANLDRRFVLVEGAASAYKPSTVEASASLPPPPAPLPAADLNQGDLASARHHFTPLLALAKYPFQFCNQAFSQQIASAFFDNGKFWKREWDLYYIWGPPDSGLTKPLILVRESQFQSLLDDINSHLHLGLRITDAQREGGLASRFPDHPDCLPRYLGRCGSRLQYNEMVSKAPTRRHSTVGENSSPPDTGTLEQFRQIMEEMWAIQKAKQKQAKVKKQEERLLKQRSMADSFKRTQRYLGLRGTEDHAHRTNGLPVALDPLLPTPHKFDRSVVFICVDVESYERAHHKITEIGVASLDTRHLIGVAPGKDGEAWRTFIKARHFRIKEHRHLVNSDFVQGCPDRFNYGESTFVALNAAAANIAACFCPPFAVHASNTKEEDMERIISQLNHDEPRNIIFLGHDVGNDVRYLQQLGFNPLNKGNILEALDTAVMYRVWRHEYNPTNLGKILHSFDIVGWNLHNAGNDAVYTIQAMLAICVREATVRGTSGLAAMRAQDKIDRLNTAHEYAEQRAKDDAEGWSDSEAHGDGGAAVPLR